METLWLVVLGTLTIGYFALAGFDYGTGLLLPFRGREVPLRRMNPFFLGNEVWLVAAIGVLFAAFPRLEGELLSGAHSTFTLLLAGLVLFMAAVQLRLWWWLVFTGALMVSVGWGLFLAHLLHAPWPVALGMPVLFAVHGWVFQTRRWKLFPVTALLCALPIPLAFSSIDVTGLMAHDDTLGLLAWVAVPIIPLVVLVQWSIVAISSR
ncbi:cytochrome d ubiquinol oxidase subunit II [Lentzea flaviverrucosa]|uniref:Cytochrome bd terminal oxidase subunit II n=1 Tax=Lentzea flaviverrucosa TaxID=200379 RepID=A0A1H9MP86_9PSEU|nr:cytochrome d ubiquinol oxidase subunit II [Lentzea flaviverrucosa]RDI30839.1 bd-type cytochrome oxidase subunit II [Lentzea flaviverrucosa]SER25502.1 Cytochrome bd terminal oxidase subunit II [Lentzea flaviverrucosa]